MKEASELAQNHPILVLFHEFSYNFQSNFQGKWLLTSVTVGVQDLRSCTSFQDRDHNIPVQIPEKDNKKSR